MSDFTVTTLYNNLPQLQRQAVAAAKAAVAKAAYDIEGNAKITVPVDTGNLKNSIQTAIEPGELAANVGPRGVEYAIFVEYGTGRRGDPSVPHADVAGMAPRPYLRPAAEKVRPGFIAAMEQIAKI